MNVKIEKMSVPKRLLELKNALEVILPQLFSFQRYDLLIERDEYWTLLIKGSPFFISYIFAGDKFYQDDKLIISSVDIFLPSEIKHFSGTWDEPSSEDIFEYSPIDNSSDILRWALNKIFEIDMELVIENYFIDKVYHELG